VSQSEREIGVAGAAVMGYENFPALLSAVQETNWPTVVQNETCRALSMVGEDYSGPKCTGTLVAAATDENCHMPATIGEDYSGAQCTPPAGNQTTIVLELKLTADSSQPVYQHEVSVGAGGGSR